MRSEDIRKNECRFTNIAVALPKLPSVIRYYDDFADTTRSIRNGQDLDVWRIDIDGQVNKLSFDNYGPNICLLLKSWVVWALNEHSPRTVLIYWGGVRKYNNKNFLDALFQAFFSDLSEFKSYWYEHSFPYNTGLVLSGLKSIYFFASEMSLGNLRPYHREFISSLKLPSYDKYKAVRTGTVFLTPQQELATIEYLDETSDVIVKDPSQITFDVLRYACILTISYQFGMRPLQIAKLELSDVRIYGDLNDHEKSVHIKFVRTKQRQSRKKYPMIRKIKREWACLFAEYTSRRLCSETEYNAQRSCPPESLFGLTPNSVSTTILSNSEKALKNRLGANSFRHSAAQRLVDAGASHAELSEFMGHSDSRTGLVYFAGSVTQAEKVNRAMAISPVYMSVVEIARTRTIDKDKLLGLEPEKQVGAVPHGIPISGIGSCESGQSLCSKNPVLSCYSCDKFIPVSDMNVHVHTLDSLRPVVKLFHDESRGESESPAYLQLKTTFEAISLTINVIESNEGEE